MWGGRGYIGNSVLSAQFLCKSKKIKPFNFKKETYSNIVNFWRCQSIVNKMSNNLPNLFLCYINVTAY